MNARSPSKPREIARDLGQITLVLQGGGALGAYQGGVYQAMHERGMEPNWVIGTSIGAINACLIAGNPHESRLSALSEFWKRLEQNGTLIPANALAWALPAGALGLTGAFSTVLTGIPGFFEPNFASFMGGPNARLGIDKAAYYSTEPLRRTLLELVDFEQLNKRSPRITVGAANVRHGVMRYFDSRHRALRIEHILASGALPPAFPPVEVDGEYYWDGGVLSNTPIEAVFDDSMRESGLIFTIQVWNRRGEYPQSILQVLNREKDIQYASRTESQIMRQKQIHKLRHVITELASHLPEETQKDSMIGELAAYGCLTQMHVILLQAPALAHETYLKDIDFTEEGIRTRWQAGYKDTNGLLDRAPWLDPCDPHEGVILHQYPPNPREDS